MPNIVSCSHTKTPLKISRTIDQAMFEMQQCIDLNVRANKQTGTWIDKPSMQLGSPDAFPPSVVPQVSEPKSVPLGLR